jgi:hypothetical protein
MRANTAKITSWTATVTALMAAGLAPGTAARAAPAQAVPVACNAAALATALSSAGEGATLALAAGCTYRLTAGLPAVVNDLTIAGNGATLQRSTAPGTPEFAIIQVSYGGLTVSDLNFRNGVPAIDFTSPGTLTVNGGLFGGNKGAGAIISTSPGFGPAVNGATFTGNTTAGSGGAIADYNDAGGATVTNSTFYGNTAAGEGGAIIDAAQDGAVFSNDVIYGNRSGGAGGGIADDDSTDIENCKISGNHAGTTGGGLFITSIDPLMVTGTSIWGNSAENGGGIYDGEVANQFSLPLTNDEITGNYASADGGGIYNLASAFPAGLLNLAHTTLLDNEAGSLGGGIYNGGALDAANSTISFNTAHRGGGIYQGIEGDGYGVVLTKSAVLYNTPDNCGPPGAIADCKG